MPHPRVWASALLVLVLLAGVAVASYLVIHHENQVYGDATLTLANCPQTETVNCDLVNRSKWSELAGLPIAALAIPTYLLLIGLVASGGRRPEALAYAVCIGLLTVVYSVALLVISKTQVGFLCLWCMRLYAVNLLTPILGSIAARRSPGALLKTTLRDLRAWPPPLRRAAIAFVALLALTVLGDRALRSHVRAVARAERERIEQQGGPILPAVPEESPEPKDHSSLSFALVPDATAAEPAPGAPAAPAGSPAPEGPPQPYQLKAPLRKVELSSEGIKSAPYDLQAKIGAGRPIALIFFAPGYAWSEHTLAEMSTFMRKETPQIDVYAVAGKRDDQRDEEIAESFAMLDVPHDVPLLIDDGFNATRRLSAGDVPNVALFSAQGRLVVSKIKNREHLLITANGNRPAEEIIRAVARGEDVAQVKNMFPFYPAARLLEHCAPTFNAKLFGTGAKYSFGGHGSAGKPTLVMFWSSTCKHCQVDVPQLVKWVQAHPGAVDIVGVTTIRKDEPGQPSHRAITEAYIKSLGIPWTIVEDVDGVVADIYGSISTPTTYFISPSGVIEDVWYYAHEEGFDAAMDRSLAKTKGVTTACTPAELGPGPKLATSVVGADGKRVELTSLLDKPALVHFWATWCKPCVEELPALMKFRDAMEKDGAGKVVLISVESEADGKRIQDFQKSLGLDLHSYRAPKGGLAGSLDVSYRLPRTFLVGQGGAVLAEKQGSQKWSDPAFAEGIRARLAAGGSTTR